MSLEAIKVHGMVINKIIKNQHQTKSNRTLPLIRNDLHPHNGNAIKLIQFLDNQLKKFGQASSCASDFDRLPTLSNLSKNHLFSGELLSSQYDFGRTELTTETKYETQYRRFMAVLTQALDHHIYEESSTSGDHVPIILYEQNDNFYLYIALLNVKDEITIDENTGVILDTTTLNSSTFKIALKVNLDDMFKHIEILNTELAGTDNSNGNISLQDVNNYVLWVQKGNEKIPAYIQNFIPVLYKVDDAKTTKNLMLTLRNYLNTTPLPVEDKDAIDKLVYNLLQDKAHKKQSVNIVTDIDSIIDTIAEQREIDLSENRFQDYRQNNGFENDEVGNVFFPDQKTVAGLAQLKLNVNVSGSQPIKISGMRSHAGNTMEVVDNDSDPYLRIKLEPGDVPTLKQQLSQGQFNEPNSDQN